MYKITILTVLIFVLSLIMVYGQSESERGLTDKGRFIIGTSAGLSITGVKIDGIDDTYTNISVNTSGGYFVVNNLALNLQLEYQYTKFGDEQETSFNTGITARYYFPPKIFISSGYLISIPDEGESSGFIPVELGYAHFLTRNVALEPALVMLIGAHNSQTLAYALNIGLGIYLR